MPTDDHWQKWFEAIWADREERLYGDFFGDTGPGIYPIPIAAFNAIGYPDPDPRYLFHGVFECPPNDRRNHYVYVTSGMSNAWGDTPETANPSGPSGLGYEFTLHTPERAKWAIQILHWIMAVQLAIATGRLEKEAELLQRNDRINLGNPLPSKTGEGKITHLLVTTSDAPPPELQSLNIEAVRILPTYPRQFQLATGQVDLLLLLGITTQEAEFARTQGAEGLITLLLHHHIFPLTDPARPSTV